MQPTKIIYTSELDDIAANAAESARTLTLDVSNMRQLAIAASLTYNSATDLRMQVKYRVKPSGILVTQQSIAVDAGVGTLSDYYVAKATGGANVAIGIDMPVDAYDEVQLIFSATGGGAADLINAQVSAAD